MHLLNRILGAKNTKTTVKTLKTVHSDKKQKDNFDFLRYIF